MSRAAAAVATLGLAAAALLGACAPPPPAAVEAPVGWLDEGPLLTLHDGSHDPARLAAITRGVVDSTEVVALRFEGALGPVATPGPSWVLLGRSRGVVRLILTLEPLPDGRAAAWTDTVFAPGGLVSSAYVLRTLEGHVAVDLHLTVPVLARARVGGADSAFVIELRRGGPPMPQVAAASLAPPVVLLEPRAGEPHTPLAVEGYARTRDGRVRIHVRGGVAPIDTVVTAAGDSLLWREFRLELPFAASAETVRAGAAGAAADTLGMLEVVRGR